jgi:hypothetical protein
MHHILASSDPSFVRHWYLTVDENVDDINATSVGRVVQDVLRDPNGWVKMGYSFNRVTPAAGRRMQEEKPENVFHIRVSLPRTIGRACRITDRSCADLSKNTIFLNSSRWLHGADKADLSLGDYRKALVAHEVGHLLTYSHVPCAAPGLPGDVMQEFTLKGWEGCSPSMHPTIARRPERRMTASARRVAGSPPSAR